MASQLRNFELSVDYRIWTLLRQNEWCVPLTGMPLTSITADAVTQQPLAANTFVTEDGMPWCFLDENGNIDTSAVKLYVSGALADPSTYSVNFRYGQVTFTAPPAGPVTADALVSAVHVLEGYPDDEWLKNNNLPALAWFNNLNSGESFAVGTILEDRTTFFTVDILASNRGELSDLMNDTMRYIVKIDWLDMSVNPPLSPDGSANLSFDATAQFVDGLRMKRRPRGEKLPPRIGGTEKERHRGVISFQIQSIS